MHVFIHTPIGIVKLQRRRECTNLINQGANQEQSPANTHHGKWDETLQQLQICLHLTTEVWLTSRVEYDALTAGVHCVCQESNNVKAQEGDVSTGAYIEVRRVGDAACEHS